MTAPFETPPPSDDEFETFLHDISAPEEIDFDTEMFLLHIDVSFQSTLDELGYQRLNQETARAKEELSVMFELLTTHYDMSDEMASMIARNNLHLMAVTEDEILRSIKTQYALAEYDISQGVTTPEDLTNRKTSLYTDLLFKYQMTKENQLLTVINRVMPGPQVEDNDPRFDMHVMTTLEKLVAKKNNREQNTSLVNEACKALGLQTAEHSAVYDVSRNSVDYIFSLVRHELSDKDKAYRDERVRTAARAQGFNQATAEKIVSYVDQKLVA